MNYKDATTILGLPDTWDEGMLRKAYRQKALKFHPDKNQSVDAELNCCYNVASSNIKVKFADVENVISIERYSSLTKLLRVTTLVKKIILIWKHKVENRNIGKRTRSHVDNKNALSIDALDIQKAKRLRLVLTRVVEVLEVLEVTKKSRRSH